MSADFVLHPRLAEDTVPVCDLKICRVLLMNNQLFPWLVLVPMRKNLRELFDLTASDYPIVMQEVRNAAQVFSGLMGAFKINIAALGNQVPQLHIHIIARHEQDAAWPQPVWNATAAPTPYTPEALKILVSNLRGLLS
jgi:diadenosine tetraphosphate (Ap4A) HIT family hydrolase